MTINFPYEINWTYLMVIVASIGGVVFHWWKAKKRGELSDTLIDYLFIEETGNSMGMAGGLFAAISASINLGVYDGLSLTTTAVMAFLTGYSLDSALNKGTKPTLGSYAAPNLNKSVPADNGGSV